MVTFNNFNAPFFFLSFFGQEMSLFFNKKKKKTNIHLVPFEAQYMRNYVEWDSWVIYIIQMSKILPDRYKEGMRLTGEYENMKIVLESN